MDLNSIPIFGALKARMQWLNQSQQVIAENIANANTPDFRPRHLKDQDFSALVDMTNRANEQHFRGAGVQVARPVPPSIESPLLSSAKKRVSTEEDGNVHETTPDGNAVVLEDQLVGLAETQIEYNTVLSLYRKHVGMIKTALGTGGR